MPCYHPISGWYASVKNETGKRSIVFDRNQACVDRPVSLPCGRCIGCRLERSRQWAMRCVHEASLYKDNCFITLTYNKENLPTNGSLIKSDYQLFMKRLRKFLCAGGQAKRVRFFHCGEYGDKYQRPHYHALLFGYDFKDRYYWRTSEAGSECYRSPSLEKLWTLGNSELGDVTFESAAYVARYVVKKRTGAKANEYYKGRLPEYCTMSRRPGIGMAWFEKYKADVFPHDFVVVRSGVRCKPPKFYTGKYELTNPEDCARIKLERVDRAKADRNNSPERLEVRELVKQNQISMLKRSL